MSIRRMTAVWDISQHKGGALLLLLAIADRADDNGMAWIGSRALADKTRMSRRSVIRLVDEVALTGELLVLNRPGQRSNISIVIPGLTLDEFLEGLERGIKFGARTTRGSDILSLPPQVLGLVTGLTYREPINIIGSDNLSPGGGDILSSPKSISGRMVTLRGDILSQGGDTMRPDPLLLLNDSSEGRIWTKTLGLLELQMTRSTFGHWLKGTELLSISDEGVWMVRAESTDAAEWLNHRLRSVVVKSLQQAGAEASGVEFVTE